MEYAYSTFHTRMQAMNLLLYTNNQQLIQF